jgi:hypothetical protein
MQRLMLKIAFANIKIRGLTHEAITGEKKLNIS